MRFHALNALLFFFLLFSSYGNTSYVVIDSLAGKAEIQRAGRHDWYYVQKGERLYSNDMLRVLDNSLARLVWPDGSNAYVHKNSQILITFLTSEPAKLLSHSTVFFGAVYFVIKKVLPKKISDEMRVYTPTAIISLRGTSFEIKVDKNGSTVAKVINGVVHVRTIHKTSATYLSAPYKTIVRKETDPIIAGAILQSDIDSLKSWVPSEVVEAEIKDQLARSRRDHLIITGKSEDKCIILPFTDSASYQGNWDIGKEVSSFFADIIHRSTSTMKIAAIDTSMPDPLIAAKKYNARYALTGVIQAFDIFQHAEISAQADEYRERSIARVKITIQVIDAHVGSVLWEETSTGEVSKKNKEENSWKVISTLPFDLHDEQFAGSILGQAIKQALEQLTEKISSQLETR